MVRSRSRNRGCSISDDLIVGGHELWVPIPLDGDPDDLHEQLLDRFGTDDAAAAAAALLTGVARQLGDARQPAAGRPVQLAAWGLLSEPQTLDVRALATLSLAFADTAEAADVVSSLAEGETLFEDPDTQPIDTRSGEAISVRLRPMVDDDGTTQVHEVVAVLWARPDDSAWYILSTYVDDLVEAREIGDLLEELAAGVEGL